MSGDGPEKRQFENPIQFILTVVGFAVGLGNVWRFPYLVYDNGGGAFIIIFFIILIIIGIPIFMLELALGQFSGLGPAHVFVKIAPIFQGVGYASLIVEAYIGYYYNVIIAYCLYYLILSMNSKVPWSTCGTWSSSDCVVPNASINCDTFNQLYENPVSPSEEYFYNKVLHISDSISDLGNIEYPIALSLLACWIIVFLALAKGVASLGKVSYVTATVPYVMLTVLVINGALLSGSKEGVNFYIGKVDTEKFKDPLAYKNAAVQAFYSISACTGGLITMSRFNPFKHNLLRDSYLVPILDALTGFYAGFAIFSVLGFMFKSKCAESFADVVSGGPDLAFIVYPEGLSLIVVPPLWSILFFLMMLALGFGSQFSIVETVLTAISDVYGSLANTRKKELLMRGSVCLLLYLLALPMTTRGGFYIFSLVNEFGPGYPTIVVGIFEVILVGWVYGVDQFIKDIEEMIGKKPKWFWMIWKIQWKFLTPIALIAILVATAIYESNQFSIRGSVYPGWAVAIGWILMAIPIGVIIACAIAQTYIHRADWKKLFKPHPSYYDRSNEEKRKLADAETGDLSLTYGETKVTPAVEPAQENEAYEDDTKF